MKKTEKCPNTINQEIPEYKEIEDHKEAKAIMKAYLEETITKVEEMIEMEHHPKTKESNRKCKRNSKRP